MKKLLLLPLFAALACSPVPGPDKSVSGAVLGAGWGAGAGAVVGNQFNQLGPGAAIGSAVGAAGGLLSGIGLDVNEGGQLDTNRELDSLRTLVGTNERALMALQYQLDERDTKLASQNLGMEVFFDSDRASLRGGSAAMLQRFAEQLKRNPYVGRVVIHGHTDDTGDQERNSRLSEARARTVSTFLVNQGFPADQIETVSHGAMLPLASNATESGRQLNRRVEVVIMR